MRMKGHAIHDAADYVPKPMFEYWRKRDPIARFENYLVNVKKWLSPQEHQKLITDVESYLEQERETAVNSPMPAPETAAGGVYCEDGCHEIKLKYGMPKTQLGAGAGPRSRKKESALHFK
jgi:acetoin:2,6-dichlorophenolindophenol oxidoreductase subunit alpha